MRGASATSCAASMAIASGAVASFGAVGAASRTAAPESQGDGHWKSRPMPPSGSVPVKHWHVSYSVPLEQVLGYGHWRPDSVQACWFASTSVAGHTSVAEGAGHAGLSPMASALPVTSTHAKAPPVHVQVAIAGKMPHAYCGEQTRPDAAHGAPTVSATDPEQVGSASETATGAALDVHPKARCARGASPRAVAAVQRAREDIRVRLGGLV